MGLLFLLRKLSLVFLLLSALIFSLSFAGRPSSMHVHKLADEADVADHEDETSIHERLLRVNTKDYGHYSPSPKLARPRFKLIPN